ncbi:hypothetical protein SAMN05660330_03055 [Desulforhopalus singaporensis]|uniref:Uncharacterized protein n=1 Tax=Desulforhopalus singaporensis TaxID=91360 RepID=A0A1H0TGG1_9BACT|nr:hypothetical protein SAMN05660330_03055 [Desulforhopalus singaporensis]
MQPHHRFPQRFVAHHADHIGRNSGMIHNLQQLSVAVLIPQIRHTYLLKHRLAACIGTGARLEPHWPITSVVTPCRI